MADSHEPHTATLLQNGDVLVAGGYDAVGIPGSTELFNPSSGTWATSGSLAAPRYGPTATLLSKGKVLLTGGDNGGGALSSSELYDPSTGLWTHTGSLASARLHHTANLLPNGKVLVASGYFFYGTQLDAELYDPSSGTWTSTGSLTTDRYDHTAAIMRFQPGSSVARFFTKPVLLLSGAVIAPIGPAFAGHTLLFVHLVYLDQRSGKPINHR